MLEVEDVHSLAEVLETTMISFVEVTLSAVASSLRQSLVVSPSPPGVPHLLSAPIEARPLRPLLANVLLWPSPPRCASWKTKSKMPTTKCSTTTVELKQLPLQGPFLESSTVFRALTTMVTTSSQKWYARARLLHFGVPAAEISCRELEPMARR